MGGPCYRGLRLDRSLAEFHRAVDRLRWDTDHRRTEPPSSPTGPQPARDREEQPRLAPPA